MFATDDVHALLLGPQAVTTGSNSFEKREISNDEFKEVVAWQKAGLVDVTGEDVLSEKKAPSLDDWFARTQNGLIKRITVTQTESAKRLDKAVRVSKREPNFTYAVFGTFKLERIISKELKQQATTEYCVVKAVASCKYTDDGKRVYAFLGKPTTEKFKSILLLKHDSFEDKWKIVAADTASEGEDFRTNNVNETLLKAE